jgi:hypothetical protein
MGGLDAEHRTQGRVVDEALGESIGVIRAREPQDHPLPDQPHTSSLFDYVARRRGAERIKSSCPTSRNVAMVHERGIAGA